MAQPLSAQKTNPKCFMIKLCKNNLNPYSCAVETNLILPFILLSFFPKLKANSFICAVLHVPVIH